MKELLIILVSSAIVNNVVLSQFLGLCPFLGVSKSVETAAGMGGAIIFVITLSSFVTGIIYNAILVPTNLTYLQTIVFILLIAALVQFVEMFLKKTMPSLYQALGVYLPLITTNCAPVSHCGELAFFAVDFLGKLPKYVTVDPLLLSIRSSIARESKWRYIMKKVNLRDLYPDVYKNDYLVEVTEDVLETIRAAERAEAAYDRRMYRYKANYSLDCDNGIENAILMKPQTPEMLLEEKQLREQLYAAVMALPEKQAKRIYARYYLGMRVSEIAVAEGVDSSRVSDSIRRGLKQLAKYF